MPEKNIPLELFPTADFILGAGASGRLVTAMQLILQSLGEKYQNIPPVSPQGTFDESTRQAVIVIQQRAGLQPTGLIDFITWNRIAQLYNFSSKVIFDTQNYTI